jgi:hypothetical protein
VLPSCSPGNDGVPGNVPNEFDQSVISALLCQPLAEAVVFGIALAFIVWGLTRERRAQALYVTAFYVFCALAFMAKGIPGFALAGLIAFFYLTAARRFDLLFAGRLHVGRGILILCTLGLPENSAQPFMKCALEDMLMELDMRGGELSRTHSVNPMPSCESPDDGHCSGTSGECVALSVDA